MTDDVGAKTQRHIMVVFGAGASCDSIENAKERAGAIGTPQERTTSTGEVGSTASAMS